MNQIYLTHASYISSIKQFIWNGVSELFFSKSYWDREETARLVLLPHTTLEANIGQIDGFLSQLPYKSHQNRVAYVGDWLKICPWVDRPATIISVDDEILKSCKSEESNPDPYSDIPEWSNRLSHHPQPTRLVLRVLVSPRLQERPHYRLVALFLVKRPFGKARSLMQRRLSILRTRLPVSQAPPTGWAQHHYIRIHVTHLNIRKWNVKSISCCDLYKQT